MKITDEMRKITDIPLVKKSLHTTVRTYSGLAKGSAHLMKSGGSRTVDAIVKYGPDWYDKSKPGDFSTHASRFFISNSLMVARTGFKGVRTAKGHFDRKWTIPAYAKGKNNVFQWKFGFDENGEDITGGKFARTYNRMIGKTGQPFAPLANVSDKNIGRLYKFMDWRENALTRSAERNIANGWSKASFVHSTKGMVSNQTRKLILQAVNTADDSATDMVAKSVSGVRRTYKASRTGMMTGKRVWRGAKVGAKAAAQFIKNPGQSMKILISVIAHVISNLSVTMATTIPILSIILTAIMIIILVASMFINVLNFDFVIKSQNDCEVSGANVTVCEETDMKDIAHASSITSPTSEQYKIFGYDKNGQGNLVDGTKTKFGTMHWDELGFVYYEFAGQRYYAVAMASYYTQTVGDRFRITVQDGGKEKTFNVIICDQKADQHTHAGSNGDHCLSANGSMIEFYGDPKPEFSHASPSTANPFAGATIGSMNRDLDDQHQFKGIVKNVEAVGNGSDGNNGSLGFACIGDEGNLEGGPKFDKKIWIDMNPYDPASRGQCVWFAWARAYEIYGKSLWSPPAHGIECAAKVVAQNPNDFSLSREPKVGAIFSNYGLGYSPTYGHVGIVVAINGDTLTIEESNVTGVPWNYPWQQAPGAYEVSGGWHRKTISKSVMAADSTVYANPKVSPKLESSGKALSKSSFTSKFKSTSAPSYEELKALAKSKLGMDEQAFVIALGWLAGDNLQGQDDYASYLSACCPINAFKKEGSASFVSRYQSWGAYYSYSNYLARATGANDYCRKIFKIAIENLDSRPSEANGMCSENGYNAHSINSAIYKVRYRSSHILPNGGYDGWFGVWQ